MDTKTFLSRVSAPVDELVVSLWKPSPDSPQGIFWNRGSFQNLDDAVASILAWDKDPDWTVYYAVGRMAGHHHTKDNGKPGYYRKKVHATWFKAVCLDLDIGDKYATRGEGHRALIAAVQAIGMPDPMVVSSGRGVHYYWPLTEAVETARWEKVSMALRLALAEQQVQIDTTKIHDASMVLRPVGTSHKKQVPWKTVELLYDSPDVPVEELETALAKWMHVAKPSKPRKASSMLNSVLRNCNLDVVKIGAKCKQIGALLASGGLTDAAGDIVKEPMWRGTLGIAAFATDQETAMMMLCSKHPEFDHAANMDKMSKWNAKPTTCEYFEKLCPAGCVGCQYKGVVSPASLNEEAPSLPPAVVANLTVAAAAEDPTYELPEGYYVSNGQIYTDIEVEVKEKDKDGKNVTKTVKQRKLVSPYEMHITGMFADFGKTASTAHLAVKLPISGWEVHEMPMAAVFCGGKDFSTFLANKQLIIKDAQVDTTRGFLMSYLQDVQRRMVTGMDFKHFGWQDDGSFMCGNTVVGAPHGNTARRLMGSAKLYADKVRTAGSRETWAEATKYIDHPGAEFLGVGLLTACAGVLGNVSGTSCLLISFYSHETGTGKTLSLAVGQSAFMTPDVQAMMQAKDTDNAIYHTLGLLGDLSGAIDEITTITDENRLVDLAYHASMGREKVRLTQQAEIRASQEWSAPVRVSSNKSLYDLYDMVMAKNDPVKLRTLQFELHDRTFVNQHGKTLSHILRENYGHAMPELAETVMAFGGCKAVWEKGHADFHRRFKFDFRSEERFFEGIITASYIVGKLGTAIGLFRFDLDHVIHYMLRRVVELRGAQLTTTQDALDIIGQFMQENNHQYIVSKQEAGTKDVKVQFPIPSNAVVRLDLIHDKANPVLPGSRLAINEAALKQWLRKNKDSYSRVVTELMTLGVVVMPRDRITMFRGCHQQNPGQAYCLILDPTHPRMAVALNGGKPTAVQTSMMAAVIQPSAVQP